MELTPLHKTILVTCSDGDVGLWEIIWKIHGGPYASGATLPEEIRRSTIRIVGDLLSENLIQAGFPQVQRDGTVIFQPLSRSTAETVTYIEKEWDNLGRTPNIGDIVWFKVTDAGE